MKNIITLFLLFFVTFTTFSQEVKETPKTKELGHEDKNKFRQMYDLLATPNMYRTASGAPGPEYYQQQADYKMDIVLDDKNTKISKQRTNSSQNDFPIQIVVAAISAILILVTLVPSLNKSSTLSMAPKNNEP